MKLSKRMKKTVAAILLVTMLLGVLTHHPLLLSDPKLPENYRAAIQSQARGLYSKRLPLAPVFVNVESLQNQTVRYSVFYFPFGTVGMSYHPEDGYNIEKPLAGI